MTQALGFGQLSVDGEWIGHLRRARRIDARIEAGSPLINSFATSPPERPFGGVALCVMGRAMGRDGPVAIEPEAARS